MVGLDGRIALGCLLASACQRLEVVDEEVTRGIDWPATDSDGVDDPEASSSSGVVDLPPPEPEPVCAWWPTCQCSGSRQFCELVDEITSCALVEACEGPLPFPLQRDDCLVDRLCTNGGRVDGNDVTCFAELPACVGRCNDEPELCDPDGDGVLTFACGTGGLECVYGQFCVRPVGPCGDIPRDPICVDLPADCTGFTLHEQRACVVDEHCSTLAASHGGRNVVCTAPEC